MSDDGGALPRILIVDDEQVVLESCVEILEDHPYRVATAIDGNDILDLLPEFQPDLVFVDMKLPGISGLEVLQAIIGLHEPGGEFGGAPSRTVTVNSIRIEAA